MNYVMRVGRDRKKLAAAMREYRQQLGLTQHQVGKAVGKSKSTICRLEKVDIDRVDWDLAGRILKFLGVKEEDGSGASAETGDIEFRLNLAREVLDGTPYTVAELAREPETRYGISDAERELLEIWRDLPDWARRTHIEEFRHLAGRSPPDEAREDGRRAPGRGEKKAAS